MMMIKDGLRPSYLKVPFAFFNLESEVSLRENIYLVWFYKAVWALERIDIDIKGTLENHNFKFDF